MSEPYEWKCTDCGEKANFPAEVPENYICENCKQNQGGVLLTLKTNQDGEISTVFKPKKIRLNKTTEDFIRQDCPLPEINSLFVNHHLDSIEPLKKVTVIIERNGQSLEFGKTLEEQGVKEGDALISSIDKNE